MIVDESRTYIRDLIKILTFTCKNNNFFYIFVIIFRHKLKRTQLKNFI